MRISVSRVRSLDRYLGTIEPGSTVVPALVDLGGHAEKLAELGLPADLEPGVSVLPPGLGPISKFNAEGKFLAHKDQPMETAYRQVEWTWTEWHGPYQRVERSEIRDVPYQRYPRTFIEPPAIELTVAESADGETLLVTPSLTYPPEEGSHLLHQVNLLLELFGECEILNESLTPVIRVPVNRINWQVLPPGEMPWPALAERVEPLIEQMPGGNQPVARYRLKHLNDLEPDFLAIGRAGFNGYIVFCLRGRQPLHRREPLLRQRDLYLRYRLARALADDEGGDPPGQPARGSNRASRGLGGESAPGRRR